MKTSEIAGIRFESWERQCVTCELIRKLPVFGTFEENKPKLDMLHTLGLPVERWKKKLWVYCKHSIRLSSLICLDCPCICCHLLVYLKVLSFKLTRYVQHKWKHHIYNGSNAIKNNSTRLYKTGIPTVSRQTNWLGKNARDMRSRGVETPVRMVLRVNLNSESLAIRSSTETTWPLWLRKRRKINWLLIARVTLSCPIVSSCYQGNISSLLVLITSVLIKTNRGH